MPSHICVRDLRRRKKTLTYMSPQSLPFLLISTSDLSQQTQKTNKQKQTKKDAQSIPFIGDTLATLS